MTITDIIAILLSLFFLMRGSARGFMCSLLGPISLIIATFISIFYYQITKDLMISLLIGLLGPIALYHLSKFIIKSLAKATDTDIGPSFLSRLGGALLTLAWGWIFIIITFILLALVTMQNPFLAQYHKDLTNAYSYKNTIPCVENLFPVLKETLEPKKITNESLSPQALAQDARFQRILQDPEIQQEISNHDMAKLMSNPKMMALTQQIMTDPILFKKVMAAYRTQAQQTQTKNP